MQFLDTESIKLNINLVCFVYKFIGLYPWITTFKLKMAFVEYICISSLCLVWVKEIYLVIYNVFFYKIQFEIPAVLYHR